MMNNRRYISEDIIPFKGDVIAYRKHQNDIIEKRYLYIYQITCIQTNNVYVGKRIAPLKCEDPLKDTYKGSGKNLKELKANYDWNADFVFEILQFCSNEEELNQCEIEHITRVRHVRGNECCNIHPGGEGITPLFSKQLWSDSEYREKQSKRKSELNRIMWADPYYRNLWSNQIIDRMNLPESKARSQNIMCHMWQNQEWRDLQIQRSIDRWKDPEYKQSLGDKISISLKLYWGNQEEKRKDFSAQSKLWWQDPDYRSMQSEKMTKQSKEWWSMPENKKQASYTSIKAWNDVERREQQSARMRDINKAKWSSVEARQAQAEKMSSMTRSKWEDGSLKQIHCKKIVCLEDLTSPLNGQFFQKGTIFESIKEASMSLGFCKQSSFSMGVMHHKSHPGKWVTRVGGKFCVIAQFAFLENSQ